MRKLFATFSILIFIGAGCTTFEQITTKNNSYTISKTAQDTPEDLAQEFYNALIAGDTETAKMLILEGHESDVTQFWKTYETYEVVSAVVDGKTGEWVQVNLILDFDGVEFGGSSFLKVSEIEGEWWIIAIPST